MTDSVEALDARARHDLACLNYPPSNWPLPRPGIDGSTAIDVLVVGGGQLGQAAAYALIRSGIRNLRVIDRASRGLEGPWATTARMPTLRSPKHLTGPDLGVPSLTFRAWYEARHGRDGWEALYKIGRTTWVDYLLWVRDLTGVPVENDVAVARLDPDGDTFRAVLEHADGRREQISARHVVFALGREGYGGARLPPFPSLPVPDGSGRIWHTSEPIHDFSPFRGGGIAVLGANASAFDNAAEALEAGVSRVVMWSRRPHLPQINYTRGMTAGYLQGFIDLEDSVRWALSTRLADEAAPPPHESVLRCEAHEGFEIRFGEGWRDLAVGEAGVSVTTGSGIELFDGAVLGTGYTVDLARQPALAAVAGDTLLWRDRVSADAAALYPELARHPYLDDGFGLVSRSMTGPMQRRIHLLGTPAAVSHGTLAADIPGLGPSSLRLAGAVSRALFAEDSSDLNQRLFEFDEPELQSTPYFVPKR